MALHLPVKLGLYLHVELGAGLPPSRSGWLKWSAFGSGHQVFDAVYVQVALGLAWLVNVFQVLCFAVPMLHTSVR